MEWLEIVLWILGAGYALGAAYTWFVWRAVLADSPKRMLFVILLWPLFWLAMGNAHIN